MWWELVIDVLWPGGGRKSTERSVEKADSGTLAAEFRVPGEFKRRLNESGWLADEVIAARDAAAGKVALAARDDHGLGTDRGAATTAVEVAPARVRARADRRPRGHLRDEPLERWGRGDRVRGQGQARRAPLVASRTGAADRSAGGGDSTDRMVELAGMEPLPVTWNGDQSADELIELLSR
jgi:hypothetical protein